MLINSIVWKTEPEIFKIGSFALRWYGLLVAIGFIISYHIIKQFFKEHSITIKTLNNLTIHLFIGALFGARLGHCFFYNFDYFLDNPLKIILPINNNPEGRLQNFGFQGLASHGAAIGIFAALVLFSYRSKMPLLWLLDRIVIVAALGFVFIRLGNLFHSVIYGIETDLPWGFIFVRNQETLAKHPTQLYEAFSYLIIFIFLLFLLKKRKNTLKDGTISGVFLVFLFSIRFLIEFLKDGRKFLFAGISFNISHLLSIPFIMTGVILLLYIYSNVKNQNTLYE